MPRRPCHTSACRFTRSLGCRAAPGQSWPDRAFPGLPCRFHTRPPLALPLHVGRDAPGLANSSPSLPCPAIPGICHDLASRSRRASPIPAQPHQSPQCRAFPCLPCRSTPILGKPWLACRARPGHDSPNRALPAGPIPSFPQRVKPRLPSRDVLCRAVPCSATPLRAMTAPPRHSPCRPPLVQPRRPSQSEPGEAPGDLPGGLTALPTCLPRSPRGTAPSYRPSGGGVRPDRWRTRRC